MQIKDATRSVARSVLGRRLATLVEAELRRRLSYAAEYRSRLRSRHGLEIGGPSETFSDFGQVPIYDVLGSLDNCLYSANTIWAGQVQQGKSFSYYPGKQPGAQLICEATDLQPIRDCSYDCVIACHCLEHVANPLRALSEWKRVLKNDGLLLLILPHKDGTFDWRRPVTPLAHMIQDYENAVGEEDLTHLPEILELHDLSKDPTAGTKEQFRQRCLANHVNRTMHHHIFDTMTAMQIVDYMGFALLRVDNLRPHHITLLASPSDRLVDNHRFMGEDSRHWSRSPFPSDRQRMQRSMR